MNKNIKRKILLQDCFFLSENYNLRCVNCQLTISTPNAFSAPKKNGRKWRERCYQSEFNFSFAYNIFTFCDGFDMF